MNPRQRGVGGLLVDKGGKFSIRDVVVCQEFVEVGSWDFRNDEWFVAKSRILKKRVEDFLVFLV